MTAYVVVWEDEEGAQATYGPFDDPAVAEVVAERIKATLRLASWRHEQDTEHPDDQPIFAWVVGLQEPSRALESNPFDDTPLEVIADTDSYPE